MLRKILPCPQLLSLFVSPLLSFPPSLEITSPNGSRVDHLLCLFLLFYSSMVHSPYLYREEERCSFYLEGGEMVEFAL